MKRILLVDDEAHFAEALAERLSFRGFDTKVAFDVASAMETLLDTVFEGFILDINLPDGNGVDLLRIIRDKWPEVIVLMLSGHGTEEDRKTCMGLGATAFLNKPAKVDELAAILHSKEEG